MSDPILVYGAYGHTGRFVVAELRRRGWTPIAAGRDRNALAELGRLGVPTHHVAVDEPDELAHAAGSARAILNCAGPFAATAAPLIDAALRVGVPYLDVTGEPDVASAVFERFGSAAAARDVVLMPAASFFGALGDLLATSALDGWSRVDGIAIAYAVNQWKPTRGTRLAVKRMGGNRLVFRHGHLTVRSTPPPIVEWVFPSPFGLRSMIGDYPSPESVLIPRHIATPDVEVFMTVDAIRDLREADSGGPTPVEDPGRSGQTFAVHATATRDGETRSAIASGDDIYATTAPILVECMERILHIGSGHGGVHAPGGFFGPRDFLNHSTLSIRRSRSTRQV